MLTPMMSIVFYVVAGLVASTALLTLLAIFFGNPQGFPEKITVVVRDEKEKSVVSKRIENLTLTKEAQSMPQGSIPKSYLTYQELIDTIPEEHRKDTVQVYDEVLRQLYVIQHLVTAGENDVLPEGHPIIVIRTIKKELQ